MDFALNFKTLARRTLLLLALAAPSVIPLPVVTTPSEFIPLGRTEKYSCVSDGSFVEWLVSVPGMALLALRPDDGNTMINSIMRGYGIAMDRNFPFVLLVNASSLNNGTVLQCTSIVSEVATLSSSVAIYVFGPPDVPSALGVIPLGADTLELSWKPPFSPPGVNTSYTVLVSDLSAPSKEPALTVGPILEPRFTYHAPKQSSLCSQRYEFRVMARNDAGEGYPSTPLITSAPAVPELGILRSEVLSIAENNIAINLLFFTARACENFPVEGYYIKVVNELTNDSAVKQIAQYTTSTNGSYFEVKLSSPSDGLQPNMRYTCSVLAYNAVGRSSPSSIVVYTTDVQSSTITGSDHQLNVTCFFAEGTLAKGCVVCLEKSGEVVYQMIPRVNGTAKGVIRTEFSVDCYNISVMDWEEDGSIGSLPVPVNSATSSILLHSGSQRCGATSVAALLSAPPMLSPTPVRSLLPTFSGLQPTSSDSSLMVERDNSSIEIISAGAICGVAILSVVMVVAMVLGCHLKTRKMVVSIIFPRSTEIHSMFTLPPQTSAIPKPEPYLSYHSARNQLEANPNEEVEMAHYDAVQLNRMNTMQTSSGPQPYEELVRPHKLSSSYIHAPSSDYGYAVLNQCPSYSTLESNPLQFDFIHETFHEYSELQEPTSNQYEPVEEAAVVYEGLYESVPTAGSNV